MVSTLLGKKKTEEEENSEYTLRKKTRLINKKRASTLLGKKNDEKERG